MTTILQHNNIPIFFNSNAFNSYIDIYLNNVLETHNHNLSTIYLNFMNSLQNCKLYDPNVLNNIKINHDTTINLLNLNCRSLFKKLNDFECFLSSCNIKFDVITFSETWLKPHNENFATLSNYNSLTTNRIHKIGGGRGKRGKLTNGAS